VENVVLEDGCWIQDLVLGLSGDANNQKQLRRGLKSLTRDLKRDGVITRAERQQILACVVVRESDDDDDDGESADYDDEPAGEDEDEDD
jgi:hypothetical protein